MGEPSGGLASGGIKRLEEATPKHLVKKNLEKEAIYQDMEKATTFTKIESKEHSEKSKKFFGLDKNQLLVVVMMILMCSILYSVLLHLTRKAAQCQDTLEDIVRQRKEWQRKVMEMRNRGKTDS